MSIRTNAENLRSALAVEKRKTAAWRRLAEDLYNDATNGDWLGESALSEYEERFSKARKRS